MRIRSRKIKIEQVTKTDKTSGNGSQKVVLAVPRNTKIKVKKS